jgi:hypothetical protein
LRAAQRVHSFDAGPHVRLRAHLKQRAEQRDQSPQRGKLRFRKAVAMGRDPRRADAVDLADAARRPEAMNEGDVVGLPLRLHLANDREVRDVAGADPAAATQ